MSTHREYRHVGGGRYRMVDVLLCDRCRVEVAPGEGYRTNNARYPDQCGECHDVLLNEARRGTINDRDLQVTIDLRDIAERLGVAVQL